MVSYFKFVYNCALLRITEFKLCITPNNLFCQGLCCVNKTRNLGQGCYVMYSGVFHTATRAAGCMGVFMNEIIKECMILVLQ